MDVSHATIDISRWDSYTGKVLPDGKYEMVAVDWAKTGYPMAIMKSSEGTVLDPSFNIQWASAKLANIPRVAYHYFRSDINAIQQAQKQKDILSSDWTENDYVAVDFEKIYGSVTPNQALMGLGSFLYETDKWVRPDHVFIYTGGSFWYVCGGKTATWAGKYRLWVAHYPWDLTLQNPTWSEAQLVSLQNYIAAGKATPDNFYPFYSSIQPWGKNWSIWQWTARLSPRQIPGYYANKLAVDYNYIYMDLGQAPQYITCPTCNGSGKILV
jgi:GH25 family lysozyme M1 (1,4-beta-N-acetylmuramidase)